MLIRPDHRGWTTETLATRLCDMLHGRAFTPAPTGDNSPDWVLAVETNDEWLSPRGDGAWQVSFRRTVAPAGFAELVASRIGPVEP